MAAWWQDRWQWVFRTSGDEPLPITLTRRRIFILPTRTGLLYALVLLAMLAGAINYELSLGHALVFLLASLGIVSMVHACRNLIGLRLLPGRAEAVFAGELAHFPVLLENTAAYPRHALTLRFSMQQAVRFNLAAHAQAKIELPCLTTQRGQFNPGRLILSTRYPLGLFRAWSRPRAKLSCLVYPRPISTPLPAAAHASHLGAERHSNDPDDFAGLRQWQPNDSTRHIAWKAVAHDIERPLLIKQFSGGATEELWLDFALTPDAGDLETRLSLLTGWVIAAAQINARYGLRLPGHSISPAQGSLHRAACLEALAIYAE